jgi:hypothetical protein
MSTSPDHPTPARPLGQPVGPYEDQLAALAEQVRCHVPVQPEHPHHGTDPVPVQIVYGLVYDPALRAERPAWSVRFVVGLTPGGRTRRWGRTQAATLTKALAAARDLQRETSRGISRSGGSPRPGRTS